MSRGRGARDARILWAPWRSAFILGPRKPGCVLCAAKRARGARPDRVVDRGRRAFTLLNLYPYTNGHLLIAPYRHVGDLAQLTAPEWAELLHLSRRAIRRLRAALHPKGFNLGLNLGRAAGAGVQGHLHLHIVPRWPGDTNFMPITGHARVMSQSLDALARILARPARR